MTGRTVPTRWSSWPACSRTTGRPAPRWRHGSSRTAISRTAFWVVEPVVATVPAVAVTPEPVAVDVQAAPGTSTIAAQRRDAGRP